MSMPSATDKSAMVSVWRTPLVILICGGLIGSIGFGPRAALGLFLTPMSAANGWSREVFALALAIQVLVWGTAQPFVGAIADRYGSLRVLSAGALLYCVGLALMAYSTTPGVLDLTAGLLTGLGIAGSLVHDRHCGLRQVDSAAYAHARVRCRHRRRLIRAISVLAAGSRVHRLVRLAAGADRVRPHHAAGDPAGVRGAHGADGYDRQARCRHAAVVVAGLGRSIRPPHPTCCSCSASSPAVSNCCLSPCICRLIWSTAACRSIPAPGPSAPSACSTSSVRSRPAGSATACRSAIYCRSSMCCARWRSSSSSCCR